jgi:hypothetical protein
MNSDIEALKETIRQELPHLLRSDPYFRDYVYELTRQEYANRVETQDRFHEILEEMRRDREEQSRKWEEQSRKWDEQTRKSVEQDKKWAENVKRWEEQDKKWAENVKRWEEQDKKWEEHVKRWHEQDKRWGEQAQKWLEQRRESEAWHREFERVHEEIMAIARKHDRTIGALGARWGTQSEAAFRNALAGILEENFGVQVLRVNEYDDQGVVFGRPEQVELDIIITNGLLVICELKSSVDKAGMYAFERKARFYESRHNRKADRLIVISPMIDAKAQKVADRLGIITYSDSVEVKNL